MKSKLAFATLLLIFTSVHSFAQQSMEWGLKAGGNYFKVGGRSFDNTYNPSFSGGAYAEVNYSSHFTVQPELLFNMVQAKTSDAFNQIYNTYGAVSGQLVTLDYVAVPILFAYKPVPELSILFGPQYGFLIRSDYGTDGGKESKQFFPE